MISKGQFGAAVALLALAAQAERVSAQRDVAFHILVRRAVADAFSGHREHAGR